MSVEDAISISSDDSNGEEQLTSRRALFEPAVRCVVEALGGPEAGVYRLGDQVLGCLKDLKKLWRKDDTDDERTIARIFWDVRVLPNDLVPILLATAGKGLVEDSRAIVCADLMTAMTWPIDLAEELKELDEELDKGTDYTQLTLSHLNYKAALLRPGVIQALLGIVLPPLAKSPKERKERDGQIVNVILHLVRNLAFIKDVPANSLLSADNVEYSTLQTRLVCALSETHMMPLLLTIATNASGDSLLAGWNTLVLEIFYLLFRGVKPPSLAIDQKKAPTETLNRLLAAEERVRRDLAKISASRHSRFGTTIAVTLNPKSSTPDTSSRQSLVLHRQQAINNESGSIMDMAKKQKSKRSNKLDELGREDNFSLEARNVLQELAKEFLVACFNPFLSFLLKDIKSERPKITEKDNLRLLFVTKWFLEFFLCIRDKEGQQKWGLGLVAEVTDRGWIIWVLKRMREAVEDKPKLWTELQAGIECLTQLLLLIDAMSNAPTSTDSALIDAAEILQQQLVYNGEVLDIALESLRSYKEGTQSLTYLDSSVNLSYSLLRMLERWGKRKGDEVYVRRKKALKRRKKQGVDEEQGILDVEDEDPPSEEETTETIFTFEAFEMKFANPDITRTLLAYLARYNDFSSGEQLKRVVNLLHRQAVRAKAEGLFFNASTLYLFKTILSDQRSLPTDQPYKDLIKLINFLLRQFFKALEEEPFLAVEAFFPKNRGHWKQYSSWEPEVKSKRGRSEVVDDEGGTPQELHVKRGFSETEQIGIAIAVLVESGNTELVDWVVDVLTIVVDRRQRIVEETDAKDDDDDDNPARGLGFPSNEAIAQFEDYRIPCITETQAEAATKNPQLKLLFRLCNCKVKDPDEDELEWYVPAAIVPKELQSTLAVVRQYLAHPFQLDGKKTSSLLGKTTKRRRHRRARSSASPSDADDDDKPKAKKEKRKKEKEVYKSAAMIVDSDEEYGDIEAFLEKEKALRERTERITVEGGRLPTMKTAGTKKRRRGADLVAVKKRWKGGKGNGDAVDSAGESAPSSDADEPDVRRGSSSNVSNSDPPEPESRPKARAQPKPRFRASSFVEKMPPAKVSDRDVLEVNITSDDEVLPPRREAKKKRIVISDDD